MGLSVWTDISGTKPIIRRGNGWVAEDINPEEEAEVREQLFSEMELDQETFDQAWKDMAPYKDQISSGTHMMPSIFCYR